MPARFNIGQTVATSAALAAPTEAGQSPPNFFVATFWNDLVSLGRVLGYENLNTTSRYSQKSQRQLAAGSERVSW